MNEINFKCLLFFFWWSKEISLEGIKKMQGNKLQQNKGAAPVQEFTK